MQKQNKQEKWEIEFDEKFTNKMSISDGFFYQNHPEKKEEDIKQFISDLLSQTRQEAVEKERKDHLDTLETVQKYYEILSNEDWSHLSAKYQSLSSKKEL